MQPILILSGHDEEDHVTDIGGKIAYGQILDWMETLPRGVYPTIDAFRDTTTAHPTSDLSDQVNSAALAYPPDADGTDSAVSLLLDRLGTGYDDETMTIDR